MKNRIFSFSLLLVLFILAISCAPAPVHGQQDAPSQSPRLPAFSLADLNGNMVNSTDYDGKYIVIHIATTWCPYCNAEAPALEKLNKEYADKNVEVLIIDVKEPKELVQEKLQDRFNFTFPVLLDVDGKVAGSFAPADVLPTLARDELMLAANVLVDPQGNIIFMSLLDSRNFDAELVEIRTKLDELTKAN